MTRASSLRRLALAVALALGGCASAPRNTPAVRGAPSATRAAPTQENTARARLGVALAGLPGSPPVLDALTPQIRADLMALVDRLSEADRTTLAADQGPMASERPLLHLAAGGVSDAALLSAATSSRAADDMVLARRAAKGSSFVDLLGAQRELVRRAATRWLHKQAAAIGAKGKVVPLLFDAIDQAALALDRADIRRLAREAAVEQEPTAAGFLALSRALAWELDVARARVAFTSAGSARGAADSVDQLRETAELIEAAERARSVPDPKDVEAVVQKARALLRLRRYADASVVLAPQRERARSQLALATALASATSQGATCPGLPAIAGNALLCALAWQKDAPSAAATAVVREAWASGGGRDRNSVEAYLGLVHVLPWLYTSIGEGVDPSSRPFIERLRAMEQAIRQTGELEAEFAGLSLFVDALAAGIELASSRQPGKPARVPLPVQQALEARARELLKQKPKERFTESGVLAVSALLAQDRDVLPLIQALPEAVAAPNRLSRAVLELWAAVARERGDAAEKARATISNLLSGSQLGPLERTELVLLLAEADVALGRADKAQDVLSRIGLQLSQQNVPAALRARGAIDAAGTLVQRGDHRNAVQVLEPFSLVPMTAAGADTDLAVVARGYLLALRGLHAEGKERDEYRAKFARHLEESPRSLAASLQAWQELWRIDLDHAAAAARCSGARACLDRAEKQRAAAAARTRERVGGETARLLARGTLAAGTVKLSFHFSAENSLVPLIGFEPMLLAAGLGSPAEKRQGP